MKCTIVFPNNLFLNKDLLDKDTKVFIFQDPLFFRDIKYPVKFNKKKILMHLLSTEKYHNDLLKSGYDSELIPFFDLQSQNYFEDFLISKKIKELNSYQIIDFELRKRLLKSTSNLNIKINFYENPLFLLSNNEVNE